MGIRRSSLILLLEILVISAHTPGSESIKPVKTIVSDVGDVVDCVSIYGQPAFAGLPSLLANHTFQTKPTAYLEHLVGNVSAPSDVFQPWTKKGSCPGGTVPIVRAPDDKTLTKKSSGGVPSYKYSTAGHEYSVMYKSIVNYGTQVNMNVWNPKVETPQMFSLAQLWIVNGPSDTVNTIEAGWHVYPQLYRGNYQTRLFIYWTRDGYQRTGCYNLYCAGFVQVSKKFAPGAVISPVSTYTGTQYYINVLAFKDKGTGNWWLRVQNEWVGYWPSSIFTYLANSATIVEWGGEIYNNGKTTPHTTTQMGSGHSPSEGEDGVSAYFTNVYYVDGQNYLRTPATVSTITPSPGCYNIKVLGTPGINAGYKFYFGGPGKNAACP